MSRINRGLYLVATMAYLVGCLSGQKAKQPEPKDDVEQRQVVLWTALKKSLTAPDGDRYFENNVKDVVIPGGAADLQLLRGTIVSLELSGATKKMVLALSDGKTSEVTLYLSPAVLDAGTKFHLDQRVEFRGVAKEFQKDPFMFSLFEAEVKALEGRSK